MEEISAKRFRDLRAPANLTIDDDAAYKQASSNEQNFNDNSIIIADYML